ncbi:MAG: hypothetical protein K6T29_00830 [Peptococcaceae bacterium]|nr:hypothetical protein [Peptococcaceae bacterium]
MDLTWLFFILCPYMLIYFYFCDFTNWAHWKITIFWTLGLVIIVLSWFLINYLNPHPYQFPAPFFNLRER